MPRRLFFHHIQKTAGMSLHAAFVEQYGTDAVTPQIYGVSVPEALRLNAHRAVVAGHVVAVPGHPVPRDRYSVTVLRDPVERFVSHLFFHMRETGLPVPTATPSGEWWNEALDRVERGEIRVANWQVESLFRYGTATDTRDGEAKLRAACAALEQFNLVGLVESLDESLSIIAIECGWSGRPALPVVNTTSSRPRVPGLPPEIVKRLEQLNVLDSELYARGQALYAKSRHDTLRAMAAGGGIRSAPEPEPESATRAAPAAIRMGTREVAFMSCVVQSEGNAVTSVETGSPMEISLDLEWESSCSDVTAGFRIRDLKGVVVYGTNTHLSGYRMSGEPQDRASAAWRMVCDLAPGHYYIDAALHPSNTHDAHCYDYVEPIAEFDVVEGSGARFEGAVNLRPQLHVRHGNATIHRLSSEVTSGPIDDFRAVIDAAATPRRLGAGMTGNVTITLCNSGGAAWPCGDPHPVRVAYHWRDASGRNVAYEGERTELPHDIAPGKLVTLQAEVRTPIEPGVYVLHWTLVQEAVAWFSDREPTAAAEVQVEIVAA